MMRFKPGDVVYERWAPTHLWMVSPMNKQSDPNDIVFVHPLFTDPTDDDLIKGIFDDQLLHADIVLLGSFRLKLDNLLREMAKGPK